MWENMWGDRARVKTTDLELGTTFFHEWQMVEKKIHDRRIDETRQYGGRVLLKSR